MIKIAYIVNRFVPGGLKTYLLSYVSKLNKDEFEITFITCQNKNEPVSYKDLDELGVEVIELASIKNLPLYLSQLYKVLKHRRFDIVQACMNSLNVFPLFISKCAGIKRRISCNLSTSHPSEKSNMLKNVLRRFGTWDATDYVANSNLSAKWLFGKRIDQVRVFPNAMNLKKFKFDNEAREQTRERLGLSDSFVIGTVARYCYQKNHETLIDIFRDVHEKDNSARLLLVGWGELKEKVFEQIHSYGLDEFVVDLGATEDLPAIYSALDCFVLPSFYEGLPIVGIEAQASGCPCIFSSEITSEVQFGPEVDFIPLDKEPSQWASAVLSFKGAERYNCIPELEKEGYDLSTEAKVLESFYRA
ncbi:glycosyltransferase [Anaerotardibacter muris]|uniref:glycosyltransferase n=1 Tax=Anaerotardibacter muris TaxID=2941505 RepID=UPI0020409CEB|nr:glycosyltransferase [Anaerotardibacter muris]